MLASQNFRKIRNETFSIFGVNQPDSFSSN